MEIIIPKRTSIEPTRELKVIFSLNIIYAIINTLGAYIVATTADKLEPIFFKDSKKKRSAIPTPTKPLIISMNISELENSG